MRVWPPVEPGGGLQQGVDRRAALRRVGLRHERDLRDQQARADVEEHLVAEERGDVLQGHAELLLERVERLVGAERPLERLVDLRLALAEAEVDERDRVARDVADQLADVGRLRAAVGLRPELDAGAVVRRDDGRAQRDERAPGLASTELPKASSSSSSPAPLT